MRKTVGKKWWHHCFRFFAKQHLQSCFSGDRTQTVQATSRSENCWVALNASVGVYVCKERIPWMGRWESAIMSHAGRKDREWGQNKKKKVEGGQEDRESDGDRLRARERAPKEQLQKLKRRCGTKPPGIVSNSTKLCQTWTHKDTQECVRTHI